MFHLDIVIDSAVMYERLSFLTYLIRLCWHHCLQQIPVRPTQLHFYELISQLWWIKRKQSLFPDGGSLTRICDWFDTDSLW